METRDGVNNTDYLVTMAPLKTGDIYIYRQKVNSQFSKCEVDVLEAGKMGKHKDPSDFDQG